MKENIIIKVISKIYVSIVSFFIFIFLLCIGLFIVLQNGLYLDTLTLPNISLQHAALRWNQRLELSLGELSFKNVSNNTQVPKPNLEEIDTLLIKVHPFLEWFDSIHIEKIHYGNIQTTLHYKRKSGGNITLEAPQIDAHINIKLHQHYLQVHIKKLHDKQHAINLQGDMILDTSNALVYTKIDANIHNDANLTFYGIANTQHLNYVVKSRKDIVNISYLIQLANLPKEVHYWAYEAIQMQKLHLIKMSGSIDFNHIKDAHKHMYILADVKKLHYKYNPNLDAIHTKHTLLEFKNGVLYIKPQKAFSYGMALDKSWLKIDFTKPQELLTLHLLFNGQLNKNMLKILETYEIQLPFLQHSGSVKTNLTIQVNLRTIAVDAQGTFFTKKANFDYLGLNLDIRNTLVTLNNYDVNISKMYVQLKDIARAFVQVHYNAKNASGKIDFRFQDIHYKNFIHLHNAKKALHASYIISKQGDFINIAQSQWRYNQHTITLEQLKHIPFNVQTLRVTLPPSYYSIDTISRGYIGGTIDIKKQIAHFQVDLLKFHFAGIDLTQTITPFKVVYNAKGLHISSSEPTYFTLNGSPYTLGALNLHLKDNLLKIKRTQLQISDYITTKIYAQYNIQTKKAHMSLNKFLLVNPANQTILYKNNKILLSSSFQKDTIHISSKELNADFYSNEKGWKLHIDSLDTIANKSPLLKKYKLTKGNVIFSKNNTEKYTHFQADIDYPYKIFKDINHYNIKGKLKKNGAFYCKINKLASIDYNTKVQINVHDAVIDINQMLLGLNTLNTQKKSSTYEPKVILRGSNTQLYLGNNRYVLSDTIALQYVHDILTAQLQYNTGIANLRYEKGIFNLYGHKFNDKFMDKLLSLSKFTGGSLDFSLSGTLNNYKAIFFISNTTIKDYVLLNNILAFVNTVPSLVTFSIPGYSKEGLKVKQAYLQFSSKNKEFSISDIYVESKELTILGYGKANIPQNSIDIILNLKTDLGSDVSKIPLVGYILLDGDTLSTTLKVSGKLTDPTVTSLLAKDIVVAPLNIIKRTLLLPYKLIKGVQTLQ